METEECFECGHHVAGGDTPQVEDGRRVSMVGTRRRQRGRMALVKASPSHLSLIGAGGSSADQRRWRAFAAATSRFSSRRSPPGTAQDTRSLAIRWLPGGGVSPLPESTPPEVTSGFLVLVFSRRWVHHSSRAYPSSPACHRGYIEMYWLSTGCA